MERIRKTFGSEVRDGMTRKEESPWAISPLNLIDDHPDCFSVLALCHSEFQHTLFQPEGRSAVGMNDRENYVWWRVSRIRGKKVEKSISNWCKLSKALLNFSFRIKIKMEIRWKTKYFSCRKKEMKFNKTFSFTLWRSLSLNP